MIAPVVILNERNLQRGYARSVAWPEIASGVDILSTAAAAAAVQKEGVHARRLNKRSIFEIEHK